MTVATLSESGLKGGLSEARSRIWVDDSGKKWVMKFPLNRRAVAAHRLAERWFNGVVPETHGVEWGGMMGTAQAFVDGTTAHETPDLPGRVRNFEAIAGIAGMVALDWMVSNPDRHGNNWMVDGKRVWAIDNGKRVEDTTLRDVMAPVYRSDLDDDRWWAPILIDGIRGIIDSIRREGREACDVWREWSDEPIADWYGRADRLAAWATKWETELRDLER